VSVGDSILNLHGANVYSHPETRNKPNKTYPSGRICARNTCSVVLSIYNSEEWCWEHSPERSFEPDPELSERARRIHARRYDKTDFTHGTYFAYCFRGCRCEDCTKAHAYVLETRAIKPRGKGRK